MADRTYGTDYQGLDLRHLLTRKLAGCETRNAYSEVASVGVSTPLICWKMTRVAVDRFKV